MPHLLEKSLAPFRIGAVPAARARTGLSANPSTGLSPLPAGPEAAVTELAGWMEHRHTLLLRTLLDRTEDLRATGADGVALGTHRVLGELRRDARLKYAEFRERWEPRLEPQALLPFLNRNQWIVPHPEGGYVLTGKGTRKEARMLYLQTGHDMATDCARQWASLAGRLQAFQASFASEWHTATVIADDDATRLLPVLEAALRDAEFEAWKRMRLSLGDLAEEAFIRAGARWETRVFPDPEALVRGTLHSWTEFSPSRNGWSGLMRALSFAAERMTLAMLDHYERKWDMYLRGLPSG